MRASRLAFSIALTLALGIGAGHAETWKMATKQPSDGPEGKVFQYFADQAGKYTGGKVTVQVFPNEQLGKEAAILEQLKIGTVHIYAEGSIFLQKWVPDIRWSNAPFLFDDRGHWVRFMHSPMVASWFKKAQDEAGIGMLGDTTDVLRGPYRVMVTKGPIKQVADLKGIKMRMANDKAGVEVWTYLGTEVRVLGWAETYDGISKGIVNAATSPVALVESMRFQEVAPVITRTDEYWQSIAFMMNQKAFDRLPKDQQAGLLKAHKDAAKYSEELMGKETIESLARMKAKGVVYNEIDLKPFVKHMLDFYKAKEASGELPKGFMDVVEATRKKTS